jgi:superoxide dismutase, Fe-Mn family
MYRRQFVQTLGISAVVWSVGSSFPFTKAVAVTPAKASSQPKAGKGEFTIPPLTYDYKALEPHIDARTMRLHHDKHHAGYVKNLNAAVAKYPNLQDKSVEYLVENLKKLPADIQKAVKNNGGGHINHTMYWKIMEPNGAKKPTGKLAAAIDSSFGSFDKFKAQFEAAGTKHFGSGWVWLVLQNGKLQIVTTPNQDSPLMSGLSPVMGNDLWEHAYYLTYQNKRPDFLKAWWNVVNWTEVSKRYDKFLTT